MNQRGELTTFEGNGKPDVGSKIAESCERMGSPRKKKAR